MQIFNFYYHATPIHLKHFIFRWNYFYTKNHFSVNNLTMLWDYKAKELKRYIHFYCMLNLWIYILRLSAIITAICTCIAAHSILFITSNRRNHKEIGWYQIFLTFPTDTLNKTAHFQKSDICYSIAIVNVRMYSC